MVLAAEIDPPKQATITTALDGSSATPPTIIAVVKLAAVVMMKSVNALISRTNQAIFISVLSLLKSSQGSLC